MLLSSPFHDLTKVLIQRSTLCLIQIYYQTELLNTCLSEMSRTQLTPYRENKVNFKWNVLKKGKVQKAHLQVLALSTTNMLPHFLRSRLWSSILFNIRLRSSKSSRLSSTSLW